jgi:hypothetical protein
MLIGGELVDRRGVGVDDGAHVDAPSSLRERSARGSVRPGGTLDERASRGRVERNTR